MATKKLNIPSKAKAVKGQAKGAGDLGGKFSPEEAASAMNSAIAATYARQPDFYGGTYCVGCGTHFHLREFDGDSLKDSTANITKKKAKKGGYKPSNKAGEPSK